MICPSCRSRDSLDNRYCTLCGAIFREDVAYKRAPRLLLRRGALIRLVAVVLAAIVSAWLARQFVAVQPIGHLTDPQMAAVYGGIAGAIIVYIVSAFRLLYLRNTYRVRLAATNTRVHSQMTRIRERWEDEVKAKEHSSWARKHLANAHLLCNDVAQSIKDFQKAYEVGARDLDVLNNAGVAFIRAGRRRHAMDMFNLAANADSDSLQVQSNLAHFYGSVVLREMREENDGLAAVNRCLSAKPELPVYHCRLGLIHLQLQNLDAATAAFQDALQNAQTKTEQADARNNLGMIKLLQGDTKAALIEFQQALRLDNSHARALSNQGIALLRLGSVREGIDRMLRASIMDQYSAHVSNNIGSALCQLGAINPGIRSLRKSMDQDPNLFEPVYNIGVTYVDHNMPDLGQRYLERALEINPRSWEVMLALGVSYLQQEMFAEARKLMEQAMEIARNQPRVVAAYALCLGLTFEYDQSIELFQEALGMEKDPIFYSHMAYVHMQMGDIQKASEELAVAIGLDERNPYMQDNYGLTQAEQKQWDAAQRHFRSALRLKRDMHREHYHIGYVFVAVKKWDYALQEWEIAAKHEGAYADAYANLGVLYYIKEQPTKAVVQFRKVLSIRQGLFRDYSNLALALCRQGVQIKKTARNPFDSRSRRAAGIFDQAVGIFDQALELAPENVVLHSNRGLACFFANRLEDALEEWTMVSRLDPEYAKTRGELDENAVFDETAVSFVEINIAERAIMEPLKTAGFLPVLSSSYDSDQWELLLDDDQLANVPKLQRESEQLERKLRALQV